MLNPSESFGSRRSSRPLVIGMLAVAGVAGSLAAQDALPPSSLAEPPRLPEAPERVPAPPAVRPSPAGVDPLDVTGRDFAGVRLPGVPQRAAVSLAGARAWVWSEGGSQRLLLQGDVRVGLGLYSFTAAQAVVWIQDISEAGRAAEGGAGAEPPVRQIVVYFDRVSDPGAQAGIAQAGDRLLVTGVLAGDLTLRYDALVQGRPATAVAARAEEAGGGSVFLREAEQRFARYLRQQLTGERDPGAAPALAEAEGLSPDAVRQSPTGPITPGISRPYEPDSPLVRAPTPAVPTGLSPTDLPPVERIEPIFAEQGIVTFAVGTSVPGPLDPHAPGPEEAPVRLVGGAGGEDNTLLLSGGVAVQYTDPQSTRSLQITAQRAVVFLAPGPLTDLLRFEPEQVRGIYLEGDVVATDGTYTLRGPKIYYDLHRNRAVLVDAVFHTFDAERGLPLYVRARSIRQQAANQFTAEGARLTTTSFHDPVFSIGATNVTVTQRELGGTDAAGRRRTATHVDARNLTIRAGDVPFFWWPRFRGDVDNIPLRELRLENSSRSGTALKTGWDVFGVTGIEPPRGVDSVALLDLYFDRGPAFGTSTTWLRPDVEGRLFAYYLPIDYGRDVLSSGVKRGREHEFRGMTLLENRLELDDDWTLFLEGAYVSDENFVDAFFKPLAYEGREITNAAYLRRLEENSAFTVLAKGSLNDFTPNQYLLSSQGYAVDKLPEVTYSRLADDLFAQEAPGLVTWTHEYRLSRMALNFTEPTAAELGFDTRALARAAFGFEDPNRSIADALRAAGYTEEPVLRFDTRHELASTFSYGPVKINPFVVGRFTAYDEDFDTFNNGDGENSRLWGATGTRFSTQITRVNNLIDSSLFDLHRTRHIVEPSVTVWTAGANLSQNDLPIYDEPVESVATGSAVRTGVSQTWQTQRGGPGRWRSVDVFKLNTHLVYSSGDADRRESPIKRFFDYRPEHSLLGDFATVEAAWQVTDAVGLTANHIYDFDIDQPAMTSAGGVVQHSPEFSSYAEARYINALDATYVNFGVGYQLTRRYTVDASTTYDTDRDEFQSYSLSLRRRSAEAILGLSLGYSEITDEASIGLIFEPAVSQGRAQTNERLRTIGR